MSKNIRYVITGRSWPGATPDAYGPPGEEAP